MESPGIDSKILDYALSHDIATNSSSYNAESLLLEKIQPSSLPQFIDPVEERYKCFYSERIRELRSPKLDLDRESTRLLAATLKHSRTEVSLSYEEVLPPVQHLFDYFKPDQPLRTEQEDLIFQSRVSQNTASLSFPLLLPSEESVFGSDTSQVSARFKSFPKEFLQSSGSDKLECGKESMRLMSSALRENEFSEEVSNAMYEELTRDIKVSLLSIDWII